MIANAVPQLDAFVTPTVFSWLAWALYSGTNHTTTAGMTPVFEELASLIKTTKLNTLTLVHSLSYMEQLASAETAGGEVKTPQGMFDLLVVLLMISNKANDDSSYTMKTWENLTPLCIPELKKRELAVLKQIKYNVFLKTDAYTSFCVRMEHLATQKRFISPPPALSSRQSVSYSPPHSQQLQPVQLQPLMSIPPLPLTQTPSPYFQDSFPLTPHSPLIELTPSYTLPFYTALPQAQAQAAQVPMPVPVPTTTTIPQMPSLKRTFDSTGNAFTTPNKRVHMPLSIPPTQQAPSLCSSSSLTSIQPPSWDLYPTPSRGMTNVVDHLNCECCKLTNATNSYYAMAAKL